MKRLALLFPLLALAAAPARAKDPATRFFRSALAFARAEAAKAGAQCREPLIRKSGPEPWKDRWTGLSVILDLPRSGKPGAEASARLSVGFTGTNAFDIGWFDSGVDPGKIWRSRHLHATAGDRFLVLEIPAPVDLPGLWDGFWQSVTNSFARADWAPDASGPPAPGDDEAWGLGFFPDFVERAVANGLESVWYCGFDSRERFHDGRVVGYAGPIDRSDVPGWRLILLARKKSDIERPWAAAMMFVGKDDGRSFRPEDWKNGNGCLRYRTANGRFFVLRGENATDDDPVWDGILALAACP
ncbi:MAG: hypothetical protein II839_07540 [Kiritimatiellae bacterium]|nr:hypothetical protein [Kiritimatiellia bacterium]